MSKNNKLKNKTNRLNYKLLKEALETNPQLIDLIENPSEELQLIAVSADIDALRYIKNPTEKVVKLANEKMYDNKNDNTLIKNVVVTSATILASSLLFKKLFK